MMMMETLVVADAGIFSAGIIETACLTPGEIYWIQLDGFAGASGDGDLYVIDCGNEPLAVEGGNCQVIFPGLTPDLSCVTISATVTGGFPDYTYLWTTDAGDTVGTSLDLVVCPDSTTNYNLLVTDDKGCTVDASVTVNTVDIVDACLPSSSNGCGGGWGGYGSGSKGCSSNSGYCGSSSSNSGGYCGSGSKSSSSNSGGYCGSGSNSSSGSDGGSHSNSSNSSSNSNSGWGGGGYCGSSSSSCVKAKADCPKVLVCYHPIIEESSPSSSSSGSSSGSKSSNSNSNSYSWGSSSGSGSGSDGGGRRGRRSRSSNSNSGYCGSGWGSSSSSVPTSYEACLDLCDITAQTCRRPVSSSSSSSNGCYGGWGSNSSSKSGSSKSGSSSGKHSSSSASVTYYWTLGPCGLDTLYAGCDVASLDTAGCPVDTCECEGGIASVTFQYVGPNNGTIYLLEKCDTLMAYSELNTGDYISYDEGGAKLPKTLVLSGTGINTDISLRCRDVILGVASGALVVTSYTDVVGNSCPPIPPCVDLIIDLTTDNFAGETSWLLANSAGDTVAASDVLVSATTTSDTFCVSPLRLLHLHYLR